MWTIPTMTSSEVRGVFRCGPRSTWNKKTGCTSNQTAGRACGRKRRSPQTHRRCSHPKNSRLRRNQGRPRILGRRSPVRRNNMLMWFPVCLNYLRVPYPVRQSIEEGAARSAQNVESVVSVDYARAVCGFCTGRQLKEVPVHRDLKPQHKKKVLYGVPKTDAQGASSSTTVPTADPDLTSNRLPHYSGPSRERVIQLVGEFVRRAAVMVWGDLWCVS